MTNKDEPIPPDQYERALEELRKFSLLIEEMQKNVETTRGQWAAEARRCFANSVTRLQEAGDHFIRGMKAARKAGG